MFCIIIIIVITRECGVVMRSVASVCLSVCHVCALTFESLYLKLHFWYRYAGTSSESQGQLRIGSRSRSQEEKSRTSVTEYRHSLVVRFDWKTIVLSSINQSINQSTYLFIRYCYYEIISRVLRTLASWPATWFAAGSRSLGCYSEAGSQQAT